jgi:YjbE family integral membrane protein
MNDNLVFIIGALEIMLLDLALCGDNIGIIALSTKNLPQRLARRASIIGIAGAIILRILFACGITLILSLQWLPIKLIGGLLLLDITWSFLKPHDSEKNLNIKKTNSFWDAVTIIIIADISMSLDNVLAIASAANGNVSLIVFGILLNIPIIFFGSQFVSNLMKKHAIVIYIGGAILAHTSFKMIFEDNIMTRFLNIPHTFIYGFPWIVALAIILYGIYVEKRKTSMHHKFRPCNLYRKDINK